MFWYGNQQRHGIPSSLQSKIKVQQPHERLQIMCRLCAPRSFGVTLSAGVSCSGVWHGDRPLEHIQQFYFWPLLELSPCLPAGAWICYSKENFHFRWGWSQISISKTSGAISIYLFCPILFSLKAIYQKQPLPAFNAVRSACGACSCCTLTCMLT